ncbi:malto-oligosyltrehalose trehalohydrolase [Salinarimonas ramus]|uniref:Malto-oligosyltrehalose trehalohydrolase n=1 Tax=Salinarimonas ramus TaxID=690164 RepID=A0A917Q6J6_9HYPH|nr:malto-oligosyltrehalose trehalohydrolase [Salinarimonas ramus]GGK31275.1 malto-oligosyltrehalose trehalohydrolase [Salinarimonas ramus]
MARHAHPTLWGASLVSPGRTCFRLWAPIQRQPHLAIEGREPVPMRKQDAGWFEVEVECGAGTPYRYRLDDGKLVPDPASKAQAKDVHDPSIVVDPHAFDWRNDGWRGRPLEELVLYEAHAGLLGGFEGVRGHLKALADLGITAIQLMPIGAFPGSRNWGYDGVLPYAPDAAYGTPDDLKRLVDEAHGLGLQVFLDVVYNHFGPDGNYLHAYAEPFFRNDIHTPWGAAIDFRRHEVRRFFADNVLMWLMEYRVDGLRFDAVHAIPERDWLDEVAAEVRRTIEPGRHVHLVLENEENDPGYLGREIDAQWNDDFHHCVHVMLTGEDQSYYGNYVRDTAGKLAIALEEGFVYQGQAPENGIGHPRGAPSGHLPPTAFVAHIQNHDQVGNRAFGDRLTTLVEREALDAATALHLLCPQLPMIFMGEETGAKEPFLFFTDYHDDLADAVREGRRREFKDFPEFADPQIRARIPDPNAPETFARSRPAIAGEGGDEAVLALYRRLLAARAQQIVPRLAGARAQSAEVVNEKAVIGRWRMGDGAHLVLLSNLGADPAPLGVLAVPTIEPFVVVGRPIAAGAVPAHTTIAWLEEAA